MKKVTVNFKLPTFSVMKLSSINNWFKFQWELRPKEIDTMQKYIHTEATGPYDELFTHNVYVSISDLKAVMPEQLMRELECRVCTLLDNKRYFHKVHFNPRALAV